ncbi:unnamed protein product [Prorocentrum cordatum]|uniref:Protein kinase domain-containing protein n=1 Tax=Prorocentrum cordatum TaxID=2364126 RepID=A0ABN9QJ06_9DINO|nr:unnamed protein product [Polarella glacialis]
MKAPECVAASSADASSSHAMKLPAAAGMAGAAAGEEGEPCGQAEPGGDAAPVVALPSREEVAEEELAIGSDAETPVPAQRRRRGRGLLPECADPAAAPQCPRTCLAGAGVHGQERPRRWTVGDAGHEDELASPWAQPGTNKLHAGATPILEGIGAELRQLACLCRFASLCILPISGVAHRLCATAEVLDAPLGTSGSLPPTQTILRAPRTARVSAYGGPPPDVVDIHFMDGETVEVLKDDGDSWVEATVECTFTCDSFDELDGQVYSIPKGTVKVSCDLGIKFVMSHEVFTLLRKKVEDSSIPKLPGHLQVSQQLGEGAYGEVFLCDDTTGAYGPDGSQVAVKWVRDFTRDPLFGKRVLRELRVLAAMDHPNLLQLLDVLPAPRPDFDDVYFVMPYMHCDLHKVIYSKAALTEAHSQAFTCQILRGLKYLHSAGVVHRDLKPPNILVNKDCTLRIADLGLARGRAYEEEEFSEYVVTRWYRAPELMLFPSGYFEAIDLWSVGCIHVELQARKPLFPGEHTVSMLRAISSVLGFSKERDLGWMPADGQGRDKALSLVTALELPERPTKPLEERMPGASELCLDFVRQLLTFDPNRRMSAADAVAHEYLARLRDPMAEVDAARPFAWDFDRFDPTERALKDRVYAESARHHPEILSRDAELIKQRGMASMLAAYSSQKGYVAPPSRAPRPRSEAGTPVASRSSGDCASTERAVWL